MLTFVNKMETIRKPAQRILLLLFKDILVTHTATSVANSLGMSRWGAWKILKKLASDELIILKPVGIGKTSSQQILLNWDNLILEKTLSLLLTEESIGQRRWIANFSDLKNQVEFLVLFGSILHSPKEANDIDILGVTTKKTIGKINDLVLKIQETQAKKIHSINFTEDELIKELKKPNKAFIDAVKRGVILFGQEKFIKFIRRLKAWK